MKKKGIIISFIACLTISNNLFSNEDYSPMNNYIEKETDYKEYKQLIYSTEDTTEQLSNLKETVNKNNMKVDKVESIESDLTNNSEDLMKSTEKKTKLILGETKEFLEKNHLELMEKLRYKYDITTGKTIQEEDLDLIKKQIEQIKGVLEDIDSLYQMLFEAKTRAYNEKMFFMQKEMEFLNMLKTKLDLDKEMKKEYPEIFANNEGESQKVDEKSEDKKIEVSKDSRPESIIRVEKELKNIFQYIDSPPRKKNGKEWSFSIKGKEYKSGDRLGKNYKIVKIDSSRSLMTDRKGSKIIFDIISRIVSEKSEIK